MSNTTTPHTKPKRRWRNKLFQPAPKTTGDFLCAKGISKSYSKGGLEIPVLKDVSFAVTKGEYCAIIGQSGSGKSTLLHLLATLDRPDEGSIFYEGNRIDSLSARGSDVLRNSHFGMIFQFYHLLPELTALENVLLPKMVSQNAWRFFANRGKHRRRASELLELVGLSHRLNHKPSEMSGGEMQRTAIARALMAEPKVLFADEPTGNLDRHTGEEIMKLLHRLNEEQQLTIVMVTHDLQVAASANRVMKLVDNQIVKAD